MEIRVNPERKSTSGDTVELDPAARSLKIVEE